MNMEDTLSVPAANLPLSDLFPQVVGIDSARVDAVDAILDQGDVSVCKTPRSGFTTSVVVAAHRKGLKILIVSPTRKIASSTIESAVYRIGGVYCNIPGDQSCRYVKEIIREDEFLRNIPIHKGECSKCEEYATCPVTEIERIDNFTVATMTYAKLEAIFMSEKETKRLGKKLEDIDLVIFDEAHTISYPSLAEVDLEKYVTIPNWIHYAINGVYTEFCLLRNGHWDSAGQIKDLTESNPDRYTGFQFKIPRPTSAQVFHLQMKQLLEIAEIRKECWPKDADDHVLALKNIINIMGGPRATISYIKSGDAGKMIITSGQGNIERAIRSFVLGIASYARVCFVSGTLIESRPGLFAELAERELTNVIFPDLRNTNAKMHIHPSKWRFSDWDSENGIERAIKEIRKINEQVGHQPIYILAMNKRFKARLEMELRDCKNIYVDYYRSVDTMGVERQERIAIAVGLAHTQRHSCDPLAQGLDDFVRYLDSQQLRLNEVHAATWQAWSRVKDPKGEVESHVYCVGVRAEEISDVVTWGTNRTIKASSDAEGKRVWQVDVDQQFERPIVHAEERLSRGLDRHSIQEYIDRTQSAESLIDYRINSQKSILFPYNNIHNRENVDSLGNSNTLSLYNRPGNHDELEATSFAMATLFTGRLDCYACQSKRPGKDGECGFRKKETTTDIPSLIKTHLDGSEVIGFYPFDAEDQCYYCAMDIQERDEAMRLSHFLLDNNLPVLVERLVSSESYHIWIPIIPTKTLTVYKFGKQLLHDAGVKGAELYPGQKSIGSCHKGSCGDFLMLPLGIDQEKNRISEFIDSRTFEPVESVGVEIVIRLREAPESKTVIPSEEDDQE